MGLRPWGFAFHPRELEKKEFTQREIQNSAITLSSSFSAVEKSGPKARTRSSGRSL
jgi:hypothetical protein